MKKMLKGNKGFSLVELLIALLIMAVIAGTAITLFGGVLNTSKSGADRETAESIKRAILTYMNASNDMDFSGMGIVIGTSTAQNLVDELGERTTISADGADGDLRGEYGPFLEDTGIVPAHPDTGCWDIDIDMATQIITVTAAEDDDLNIFSSAS